jgi:cysteine-rich repeat protein
MRRTLSFGLACAAIAMMAGCSDSPAPPEPPGPGRCGDAVLQAARGEQCDDGNLEDRDGCSAQCTIESVDPCDGVEAAPEGGLVAKAIATGLERPVGGAAPGHDLRRLYILEQPGRIRVLKDGVLRPEPFLDLRSLVRDGGERGLLGLAFAPDFVVSRRFYVYYTRRSDGAEILSRYRAPTPDAADPASAESLLVTQDPAPNHNGGQLAFGPRDGLLYVGTGDGGGTGDRFNNAQNTGTLLGKVLRLDVSLSSGYQIPASNPFAADPQRRGEIWAYGLRNPWRFSFDRATGDLYIGDVGQDAYEEIDYQPSQSHGAENYGWPIVEGLGHCYRPQVACDQTGLRPPILDYSHDSGACSVIAGFAYRGCRMPWLRGTFFYSDFCAAFVRSLRVVDGQITDQRDRTAELAPGGRLGDITSYLEDARGEVYLLAHSGTVYQIVPR